MIKTIEAPTEKDILFGRDANCWNHAGNRAFRCLVAKYQEDYHSTKLRVEKVAIVSKIVDEVKASGARILRRDSRTSKWFEVDRKAYVEKVGHAIRDQRAIRQRKVRKREKTRKNIESVNCHHHLVGQDVLHKNFIANSFSKTDSISQCLYAANKIPAVDGIIAAQRAAVREQLKRELLLSSIKKKQALARELAALQRETSLLAALEANETPTSTMVQLMAQGKFRTLTGSLPLWG